MSSDPKLHEALRNRALIDLYLRPMAPLHVGKGGVEFLNEVIQFEVDGRIKPIIPSESIKGTLRSLASRLAEHISFKNLETEVALRSHMTTLRKIGEKDKHEIRNEFIKMEEIKEIEKRAEGLSNLFDNSQWEEIKEKKLELFLSIHCPICRLFGSREIAGKLIFYDAIPISETRLTTYTGTSIDRKTRTVKKGRLFKIQYIIPTENLLFRTRIIADNITGTPEAKLLALLLETVMEEGLSLGGQKSRGFGIMALDSKRQTEVKYVEFNAKPVSYEDRMTNIKKLLFINGYYETLNMKDYIEVLRG